MKRKHIFTVLFLFLCMLTLSLGTKQEVQAASKSYTIYVNRKQNLVNVVDKNNKVVRAMYCSTGRNYATIKGTYYTEAKYRWHALYGGVYGQYCTRIHGPYLFHSVPYYSTSCSKVETVEYNKLGTQASAGCIRMAVVDVKWIYDNCSLGSKVVIGEGRSLKKPSRPKLKISTSSKSGWDPTDPASSNPYYPKISLKKKASLKITKGSSFDPISVLNVSSKFSSKEVLKKNIKLSKKVNTKKLGKYKVTFTLTDPATLLSKKLTVTFTVVKAKKPAEPSTPEVEPTTPEVEPETPATPETPEVMPATPTTSEVTPETP